MFLSTFYARRFIRIWLPWFFAFIASIFAKKYLFGHPDTSPTISKWGDIFWQSQLTVGDFFRQCVFALHDSSRQLLNQDWSLGVELKGSILIPLFILLSHRKRLILLSVFAIGLLFWHTGHYYVSFIIGVLLARYGSHILPDSIRERFALKLLLLFLGILLYQSLHLAVEIFVGNVIIYRLAWTASSLGCACILIAVSSSKCLQNSLGSKPFVFLGKVSYSFYLLQFIVILCLLPQMIHLANRYGLHQPTALFFFTLIVSVAATLIFAAISYKLVEEPAIHFGHWVTQKIQGRWLIKSS